MAGGTSVQNNWWLYLLQTFNGLFSRTTWVSRYQKGKTNLDFTGARDSEWQWHQLGHMQVCTDDYIWSLIKHKYRLRKRKVNMASNIHLHQHLVGPALVAGGPMLKMEFSDLTFFTLSTARWPSLAMQLMITTMIMTIDCQWLKHTHTQPFYGPFSRTTWVSRYQKHWRHLVSDWKSRSYVMT